MVLLDKLGFTQRAAARFLGKSDRTVRSMKSGDALVDPATGMLLEVLIKYKIKPEKALELIGVDVEAAEKKTLERLGPHAAPRFYGS
jgi:hypothetical protein